MCISIILAVNYLTRFGAASNNLQHRVHPHLLISYKATSAIFWNPLQHCVLVADWQWMLSFVHPQGTPKVLMSGRIGCKSATLGWSKSIAQNTFPRFFSFFFSIFLISTYIENDICILTFIDQHGDIATHFLFHFISVMINYGVSH